MRGAMTTQISRQVETPSCVAIYSTNILCGWGFHSFSTKRVQLAILNLPQLLSQHANFAMCTTQKDMVECTYGLLCLESNHSFYRSVRCWLRLYTLIKWAFKTHLTKYTRAMMERSAVECGNVSFRSHCYFRPRPPIGPICKGQYVLSLSDRTDR